MSLKQVDKSHICVDCPLCNEVDILLYRDILLFCSLAEEIQRLKRVKVPKTTSINPIPFKDANTSDTLWQSSLRRGLENLWHACLKWHVRKFSCHVAFTAVPICFSNKSLYIMKNIYEGIEIV
jgi:hypothetical protein